MDYKNFLFVVSIVIAALIYFFIERKHNNMSTSADDTKTHSQKEEEYESFDSQELDVLAGELYKQGNMNERFLFSEKKEENNEEQLNLLKKSHLYQ